MTYKGTIEEITGIITTRSGFKRRTVQLKPKYRPSFPIQFHPAKFHLLENVETGDQVEISAHPSAAGKTDTVNLVANGIKIYRDCACENQG